ncbi:MAG TPA: hypothetical protein DCS07_10955 [Bdellovibrionales bacterium]|nr:MAG: hypothetical protein A2X97_10275 [Bdellovibrionales bacterium GWA1_52_35]OFZ37670.1 MAG: hypothetical protein A2070_00740 [Bdellovibrionales bacterium GWC1_52_8]HAR43127.1 hypothetical protein [Bdellovibrionales bacterium]HCM38701.1 hypothetical protein [Bdellovibrionales bacterium]
MSDQDQPVLHRPFLNPYGRSGMFTDTDVKILHFLWRWKLARATDLQFFEGEHAPLSTIYQRTRRLSERKFIEPIHEQNRQPTWWQLSKKGFQAIRESLGDLKEEGCLTASCLHDQLVLAFHLGELARLRFPGVTFVTEQELKRKDQDLYPEWVPKLKDRRPDGFTRILTPERSWIVAIEVETSDKAQSRLYSQMRSYAYCKEVDYVLWLTGTPLIRDRLRQAMKFYQDRNPDPHRFVDLMDFIRAGWKAPLLQDDGSRFLLPEKNVGCLVGFFEGLSQGLQRDNPR